MYKQEEADDKSSNNSDNQYNEENRVVDAIRSNMAIAVCDTLVKDNMMGRWQKIINKRNEVLTSDYIRLNQWNQNIPASAESLIILDLAKYIYKVARNIPNRLIKIYIDHLKGKRFLTAIQRKTSQCTITGLSSLCKVNKVFKKL